MNSDKLLMLPFLSTELNLIGCSSLPYKLRKRKRRRRRKKIQPKKMEFNESFSDEESTDPEDSNLSDLKVVFNSKRMISSLISVCFELVKQVKRFSAFEDNDSERDKILFDYRRLQALFDSKEKELKETLNELSKEKETSRQLKVKIENLEKKVKSLKTEKECITKQCKTNVDILNHNVKKQNLDLTHVHDVLWRKFNMVDVNFNPKNFEIIRLNQPDFNRLWSDVKFSCDPKKENLLKKALCKFQENNNMLLQENISLNSLLLGTFEEIIDITAVLADILNVKVDNISNEEMHKIFNCDQGTDTSTFRSYMGQRLSLIKELLENVKKFRFQIADDEYVCWSDAIKTTQKLWNESLKQCNSITELP